MKKILILILSTVLFFSIESNAGIVVGTGMSSVTKGRTVPILHTGYDNGTSFYSFYAVGVKTDIYYHSAYGAAYYLQQSVGMKRFGFGFGAHYSVRGYRDDYDAKEETVSDTTIGPGFRFAMYFSESWFASVETVYGIRSLMPLFLSFQNTNSLNIGFTF